MSEQSWYEELLKLAEKHGESVADRDAWLEDYHQNKTAEESFFLEYPEYK